MIVSARFLLFTEYSMTLTIATLNLLNYLAPPGAFYEFTNIYHQDEWQKKQTWLAQAIQDLDADVIGFQEVFSIDALRQQMAELGYAYFSVIDEPHTEHEYIYSHPVVALASRFPIRECFAAMPRFAPAVPVTFSRQPLHAVVDFPGLGCCDIYVVHFKSQRPSETGLNDPHLLSLWSAQNLGHWISSAQRGLEANLLHHYIVTQRADTQRPAILMGDFNQPLDSEPFAVFRSRNLYRQPESSVLLENYYLHDAWDLLRNGQAEHRPTFYEGESGYVLDYILLSLEFSLRSPDRLATVTAVNTQDSHLTRPDFEHDAFSSDHAAVVVTISLE